MKVSPSSTAETKKKALWYRKRQFVTHFGAVQISIIYFEYFVVSITSLYYYKDTFKTNNPNFYYGLSMAAMSVASLISVTICGRYVDCTRNLKRVIMMTTLVSTLGNLMYTMTYSKWFSIGGRFLCGLADGARSSIPAELSRVYNKEKICKIFSRYEFFGTIAVSIGPVVPLLFSNINFSIFQEKELGGFNWQINRNNFGCLLLFIVNFVLLFIVYFCVSNLTNDPVFEVVKHEIFSTSELQKSSVIDALSTDSSSKSNTISSEEDDKAPHKIWNITDVLSRPYLVFFLTAQAFLLAAYSQLELVVVMTAVHNFKFSLTEVGLTTAIGVSFSTFIMILIEKNLLGNPNDIYFVFIQPFIIAAIIKSMVHLAAVVANTTSSLLLLKPYLYVIVTISMSLNFLLYYGYGCTSRWLVFAITPSHSASVVESYRFNYGTLLAVVSYFTSPYIYKIDLISTLGYVILFLFMAVGLLFKRKFYLVKTK